MLTMMRYRAVILQNPNVNNGEPWVRLVVGNPNEMASAFTTNMAATMGDNNRVPIPAGY